MKPRCPLCTSPDVGPTGTRRSAYWRCEKCGATSPSPADCSSPLEDVEAAFLLAGRPAFALGLDQLPRHLRRLHAAGPTQPGADPCARSLEFHFRPG
jgi:hypothetical protein